MTKFLSLNSKPAKWVADLFSINGKQAKWVHPFFDKDYYQRESHMEFSSGQDALAHFLSTGWQQGFAPSPSFSLNQYIIAYPDVKDAGINPLLHYLEHGWRENRQAFTETGEICELLGYQNGKIVALGERKTHLHLNWTECTRISGSISYPPVDCTEIHLESRGKLIGIAKLHAVKYRYGDIELIERFRFNYYLPQGQGIETIEAKAANSLLSGASAKCPAFVGPPLTDIEDFIQSPQNSYASAIVPCSNKLIKNFIRHKLKLLSKAVCEDGEKISIIMPVYNREHLVAQAIKSVARQAHTNWELIIVDDGSSDGSVTAVRHILKEQQIEHKARLIELPHNKGVSHARNQGLKASQAPIVAYLDSDNSWDKCYLTLVVDSLVRHPKAQSVYAGQYVYFYNQVAQQSYMAGIRIKPFNRTELEQSNFIDLNIYAHRRSLYEQLGGFNEEMRRLVDWNLVLRYSSQSEPLFIPALLARYNLEMAENQITLVEDYKSNFNQISAPPKKAL